MTHSRSTSSERRYMKLYFGHAMRPLERSIVAAMRQAHEHSYSVAAIHQLWARMLELVRLLATLYYYRTGRVPTAQSVARELSFVKYKLRSTKSKPRSNL